jgi:hypothetical protein
MVLRSLGANGGIFMGKRWINGKKGEILLIFGEKLVK